MKVCPVPVMGSSLIWCLPAAVVLSGCVVGPNFQQPPAPTVTSLSPMPLAAPGNGLARQAFVRDLDIPRRWWELFHCKPLNAIITRAIDNNPTVEAARAALRIADANTRAAEGAFFPQIGASAGPTTQTPGGAGATAGGSPYTLASGRISVSFVPDVFGLNQRRVESLAAQADAQHFEVEAALLTLTSRLALAAIEEASLREEIKYAVVGITVANEVLATLRKQLEVSEATMLDVTAQQVTLSQFETTHQALRKRLAVNRDLIAALTGGFAGERLSETFDFSCLRLPAKLPVSLPASIVQRRPDVRAAEANMHAATAEIGVAIANRFPQFNLTANGGISSVAKLASLATPFLFWTIAGSAAQTLFDGMSAQQRQRAAEAGLDRAAALYRGAVITAFQNVADVLQTIEADHKLHAAASRGAKAARSNLDLARQLLGQRLANTLQVMNAQELFARASSSLAQASAAQRANTVLLFQALGGGWSEADTAGSGPQAAGLKGNVTRASAVRS